MSAEKSSELKTSLCEKIPALLLSLLLLNVLLLSYRLAELGCSSSVTFKPSSYIVSPVSKAALPCVAAMVALIFPNELKEAEDK